MNAWVSKGGIGDSLLCVDGWASDQPPTRPGCAGARSHEQEHRETWVTLSLYLEHIRIHGGSKFNRETRRPLLNFVNPSHSTSYSIPIAIITAVAYPTKGGVPTGWRILQPPCLTLACRSPIIAMEGGLHQSRKRLRSSRRGRSHSCTHKVLSRF